ncbi:MAG: efflux RND transporter permease subunit, partial [Patescibacteria group bacterium]
AIKKGASTTVENQKLLDYAKSLNLPPGYSIQTGGVNEENQKSIQSILTAMILSVMLILITMIIEFRSFRQALIIVLVIPLAIPGVFYIFALTGTPLSFPAIIGVLALFGIVVTNAIVVVEKINDNRREGMPLREAIVDASGSRLEPILLTSVTSILGLIPITLSDPLWRGLGGAIISGLLFSGIVKLFFVPIVYYSWYKTDEVKEEKRFTPISEASL